MQSSCESHNTTSRPPPVSTMKSASVSCVNATPKRKPSSPSTSIPAPCKPPPVRASRPSDNCNGKHYSQWAACIEADDPRSIILDASARRFRVQKIYLRTIAAIRWINTRRQILQGQQPQPVHTAALRQAENALRAVRASKGSLISENGNYEADNAIRNLRLSLTPALLTSYAPRTTRLGTGWMRTQA